MVRCVGSSLFLKNRFGVGYELAVEKASAETSVVALQAAVQAAVPSATLEKDIANQVAFRLPLADLARTLPASLCTPVASSKAHKAC